VIIDDMRGSMAAASFAAAIGCAFDLHFLLAQRAPSDGVVATPLNSARQRLEKGDL
jgi:hypothetical protein